MTLPHGYFLVNFVRSLKTSFILKAFRGCFLPQHFCWESLGLGYISAGIYLLKVNNRSTGARCAYVQIWRQWRCSSVFIVNIEHISHLVLVFLLVTLSIWISAGKVYPLFNSIMRSVMRICCKIFNKQVFNCFVDIRYYKVKTKNHCFTIFG